MPSTMSPTPCRRGKPPESGPPARRSARRLMRGIRPLLALAVGALAALLPAPGLAQIAVPDCPDYKELCVQADRTGGIDLRQGIAYLEGNVRGVLRSRDARFRADKLTAYRNEAQVWERMVLEGGVRLEQPGRTATAGHAVLQTEQIVLEQAVHVEDQGLTIDAARVTMENAPERMVAEGEPEAPVVIHVASALLPAGEPAPAEENGNAAPAAPDAATEAPNGSGSPSQTVPEAAPEAAPPESGDGTAMPTADAGQGDAGQGGAVLHAQKAVVTQQPRTIELTGDVLIEQTADAATLRASSARFQVDAAGEPESFRAEGDVELRQPGRVVSADVAQSRNGLETILLVGNARVQQPDQLDLTSDRIEVYTDAERGIVQGAEQQQPITLALELGQPKSYRLSEQGLNALRGKNVPQPVLQKLTPLVGRTFKTREAFSKEVAALLTPQERDQYLETIVAQAG